MVAITQRKRIEILKIEEFDFHLPEELIAQSPAPRRELARMMVIDRKTGSLDHRNFYNLPEYLLPGDVLVVNDSRVIPARLLGSKVTGGKVEIFLLKEEKGGEEGRNVWQVLVKPARGVREGTVIKFPDEMRGRVIGRISEKKWRIAFETEMAFLEYIERYGQVPLPPYIKRGEEKIPEDAERYQTIYARSPGSVAAPTAGLHFSREVLGEIQARGIPIVSVTLHVGYGTFAPVTVKEIENHVVEEESYEISPEAAALINQARRVVAVGTTSVRTLEAAADEEGRVRAGAGSTDLYIYPGYRFRRVDALITNFHLPKSSLFFLVSAFAGRELIGRAYGEAIEKRYRFYSYGDCSLIL